MRDLESESNLDELGDVSYRILKLGDVSYAILKLGYVSFKIPKMSLASKLNFWTKIRLLEKCVYFQSRFIYQFSSFLV